jgi:drug/metabolite transporter (DMT)-like permease
MTPRAWLLFAAVSVVWGVPYFFIKVAVSDGVPPAFVAWSRVTLGAAVLLPLAWRRGALSGLMDRWRAIAAYTACEVAVPFLLIALGEQYVASSLAAILIASMPLMVALLSVRFSPEDRPTGLRLAGLVVGFGGVVALLGVDVAGRPGELLGAVLILVATLGYATAPVIVNRRLADLDPLGPIAASLALATVVLAPAVAVTPPDGVLSPGALGSLAVLGVVCTALGLVLFFRLIVEAGPSRAAVITYVNPLVALVLGVLVLDERLGAMSVVGLLAILGGSWLAGAEQARTFRAGHRAVRAWTRTRHLRRARAWLASEDRRARRPRWFRARSASARSSATRSSASWCFMSTCMSSSPPRSARLGLCGRELGWERGHGVLSRTSPGTLERNRSAVDEHLPTPDAPGLAALLGALKAPGAQRAGPAELLGQLQLAG